MSQEERAAKMRDLAAAMRDRVDDTATAITSEMGSVISYTRLGQAPAPIDMLEYYAGLAGTVGQPETRAGAYASWTITKEPIGVVGAIVPWNGPIFLAMFKIAPALLAGCTIVLKPSPESPLSAYLLADAVEAAGFPPGVLNVVPGDREVGRHLVRHPGVDKIAFTGSTAAGKAIMADCAESIKRLTLELGGKSPAIVLDDADLEASLPAILFGFTQNNGQICVSNSRLIVPRKRRAEIVEAIAAGLDQVAVGDPFDTSTVVGPLVAQRQRDRVFGLLESAKAEGATVAYGGGSGGMERGWYVAPTLVTDVVQGMTIARDEIFGPVLSILDYDTEDEAIAIANDTEYGLGAAIFTTDTDRFATLARRVRAGTVNLNAHLTDYHLPFGGWKQSGIGVEGGPEAVENYLAIKVLGPFG